VYVSFLARRDFEKKRLQSTATIVQDYSSKPGRITIDHGSTVNNLQTDSCIKVFEMDCNISLIVQKSQGSSPLCLPSPPIQRQQNLEAHL